MTTIRTAWARLVEWFENGDLVPLLVLVSAVHYAAVLSGKDQPVVAVAIGLLVDLGHYRTIRAAVRYNGDDRRQMVTRWLIAATMTAVSLSYHQRYYEDWWLSVPLPLLIAALAWLQRVDRAAHPSTHHAPVMRASITHPTALPKSSAHICPHCADGFSSQPKLAAHIRWKHGKSGGEK